MAFKKRIYHCKQGMQVHEYFTYRPPYKWMKRGKRKKETSEAMRRINARMKSDRVQRLILNYFGEGDYFITLTFSEEARPAKIEQVQYIMKQLFRKIRPLYKKENTPMYWIDNIETGKKTGLFHVHLIIKALRAYRIDKIIHQYWNEKYHSITKTEELYIDGGYKRLADYIAKITTAENGAITSKFSHARNMPDVEPEVIELLHNSELNNDGTWTEPIIEKGYELVRDSIRTGINEITGLPNRTYTAIKIKENNFLNRAAVKRFEKISKPPVKIILNNRP